MLKGRSDRAQAEGYAPPSFWTIITLYECIGALQEHEETSRGIRAGNYKTCFRASFHVVRHAFRLRIVMRSRNRVVLAIGGPYGHDDTKNRLLFPFEET